MTKPLSQQKKDMSDLAADIRDIFVVNAQKHRPYLELFRYTPENIAQQKLGTFLGFFHIRDRSHESGYVVNFLTSTAKKEYFANPKRTAPESFEAALHKVNIALAELAKQGNVNWLGTIDAVLCAVESDMVHIGVAGNGTTLLIRNGTTSAISEGLASSEATTNPLKTFADITSGHIQRDDTLILTTPELFSLFSVHDLLKNTQRFSPQDFAQLIATALTNELEMVGTFVIHITKQEARRTVPSTATPRTPLNAFSEKSFQPAHPPKVETAPEQPSPDHEYTDRRTGHIYVQDTEEHLINHRISPFFFTVKEKMSDLRSALMRHGKDIAHGAAHYIATLARAILKKSLPFAATLYLRLRRTPHSVTSFTAEHFQEQKWQLWHSAFFEKMRIFTSRFRAQRPSPRTFMPRTEQAFMPQRRTRLQKIPLPDVRRIIQTFLALDYAKKLYALAAVIAIIILPLLAQRLFLSDDASQAPSFVETPSVETTLPLAQDKNVAHLDSPHTVSLAEPARSVFLLDGTTIVTSDTKVFVSADGTSYGEHTLPEGSGRILQSALMEDLQLVFLLTENSKVISFSPISKKFSENAITLGQNPIAVKGLGTYMTYLYVLDADARQILRYPREEGGFGNGTSWLKESLDFSTVQSMAIDENIYLVRDSAVEKWFRGQKQEFHLEESATPLRPIVVFTTPTTNHLYILDRDNKRIMRYGKDGALVRQFTHDLLADAQSLTIDEGKHTLAVATTSSLLSFTLPQ